MKTLILGAGIPGSGKSTFWEKYSKEHPNTIIIDTDEVRKSITGSYQKFPPTRIPIYDKMIQMANEAFASGPEEMTVIEDSTFWDNKRRIYYMDRIKGFDRAILFIIKFHDYSVCYQRNKERRHEKWVPDEVIDQMIRDFEDPTPEVSARFDEVKTVYWN